MRTFLQRLAEQPERHARKPGFQGSKAWTALVAGRPELKTFQGASASPSSGSKAGRSGEVAPVSRLASANCQGCTLPGEFAHGTSLHRPSRLKAHQRRQRTSSLTADKKLVTWQRSSSKHSAINLRFHSIVAAETSVLEGPNLSVLTRLKLLLSGVQLKGQLPAKLAAVNKGSLLPWKLAFREAPVPGHGLLSSGRESIQGP